MLMYIHFLIVTVASYYLKNLTGLLSNELPEVKYVYMYNYMMYMYVFQMFQSTSVYKILPLKFMHIEH